MPNMDILEPHREELNRIVYSRHSPHIRRLRLLQSREERDKTGLYLIDGVRFLSQAVKQNVKIETVFVAPELLQNSAAQRLVRKLQRDGVPILRVTPEVYHSVSQAEEPQGIGAIARQKWERLDQVRPSRGLCWLAVEAVQAPGNFGTILRASEAVGGVGVILIGAEADPYDPATVWASMGALFNQRLIRAAPQEFAEWKKRRQCALIGTSPTAAQDYTAVAYPDCSILLIGGEKRGLSDFMLDLCDLRVKIPMTGSADSLNVAVATGVLLYEIFNQKRGRSSGLSGSASS